jgi:predicted RecB family nuclease
MPIEREIPLDRVIDLKETTGDDEGALSIEWFNKYIETKDEETLKRILKYNEDDCKATMVMKDGLEKI